MQYMQIPLNRNTTEPMYMQMVEFIKQQIAVGNLSAGSVLPSIRTMVERHEVSKTIVSMAYAELQALGLVEGRVGQGTVVIEGPKFVSGPASLVPELSSTAGLTYDFMNRGFLEESINFSSNSPALDQLPTHTFNRCLKNVLNEDMATAFRYEPAEGYWPLRKAIASHLMDRGIVATPDEVMVTSGAQQAISLIVDELAGAGACIAVDNPCYMGALSAFASNGVRVVPISVANQGLDVDVVEEVFRKMRPRLLYTMPSYQNPTGITLDLARRHRLVELAERYDVTILEDGVCSELQLFQQAPPALYALGGPVIHCGSFSKSLLPGIRIGYVVAPPDIIRRLSLRKQAHDIGSSGLFQRALTNFLNEGLFNPHLRKVLDVYRHRYMFAQQALKQFMPQGVEWSQPQGGFGIWVRCPVQVDTTLLYLEANKAGVVFAPGKVFFPTNAPSNYLRISYGFETPDRIREGMRILGQLIETYLQRETGHRAIL